MSAPRPGSVPEHISDLGTRVVELEEKTLAPAFYHGIPTSEIIRAIRELDVPDDLTPIEIWS